MVTLSSQEERAWHTQGGGTQEGTGVGPEAEGGENMGESLYCGFLTKELGKQGKQIQDWLV